MRLLSLFLLLGFATPAQQTDGIVTSVNRSVTLTADTADFSVIAGAGLDATQQQVTQVFLDAGITGLSISGTGLGQSYDYSTAPPAALTQVLYQFAFTVPAAGLKDAATKMEALRTNPPAVLKSLQYTALLNANPSTVEAMRQTLLPQIFADAQKKAQALAAAAGLKLGGVKGVSESFYANGYSTNWIGAAQFANSFSSGNSGTGTQYTFYASVTFNVAAQ